MPEALPFAAVVDPRADDPFGPHVAYSEGLRLDTGVEPDRLVDTHCCFCGQQCGIRLKVKDNEVIGFEPRYDFPFNRGMLCPKGIKRYLQGAHPDRLLHAYRRDASAPGGFRALPYEEAIALAGSEIRRIQSTYGPHAMAVLSGASLTTEKTYLVGKFAHMALRTSNIDYNGRLCMVSAGAGNTKAFGIDRAANPWSDILGADVIWVSGANVAECAPITTDYIWQARERGARVIVVDPRVTPIARTCDLFLPIKPGRDVALFNGILHLMIENNWLDSAFIERHTVGFDEVAAQVREWTPSQTASVTGIAEKTIRQAAEWWGTAQTSFLLHARGIEHHSHGVQNVLGRSTSCWPRDASAVSSAATPPSPGRGMGRGDASTGRSATNCRARANWPIPTPAPTSRVSGGWTPTTCRSRVSMPMRFSAKSTAAKSTGCSRSALIRWSRCRTTISSAGNWRNSNSMSRSTSS